MVDFIYIVYLKLGFFSFYVVELKQNNAIKGSKNRRGQINNLRYS